MTVCVMVIDTSNRTVSSVMFACLSGLVEAMLTMPKSHDAPDRTFSMVICRLFVLLLDNQLNFPLFNAGFLFLYRDYCHKILWRR